MIIAHRDPVDIEAETVAYRETTGTQHDLVTRLGEDQGLLQPGLGTVAGGDLVRGGGKGALRAVAGADFSAG